MSRRISPKPSLTLRIPASFRFSQLQVRMVGESLELNVIELAKLIHPRPNMKKLCENHPDDIVNMAMHIYLGEKARGRVDAESELIMEHCLLIHRDGDKSVLPDMPKIRDMHSASAASPSKYIH